MLKTLPEGLRRLGHVDIAILPEDDGDFIVEVLPRHYEGAGDEGGGNITTTSSVTPFNFRDHQVRVVDIEGSPWFVAKDVARCLGYAAGTVKNGLSSVLAPLSEEERRLVPVKRTSYGAQVLDTSVISEPGLYKLILRAQSRRPEVAAFQDWVTREVLPSIRKTGAYATGQPSLAENPKMSALDLAEAQMASMQAPIARPRIKPQERRYRPDPCHPISKRYKAGLRAP